MCHASPRQVSISKTEWIRLAREVIVSTLFAKSGLQLKLTLSRRRDKVISATFSPVGGASILERWFPLSTIKYLSGARAGHPEKKNLVYDATKIMVVFTLALEAHVSKHKKRVTFRVTRSTKMPCRHPRNSKRKLYLGMEYRLSWLRKRFKHNAMVEVAHAGRITI